MGTTTFRLVGADGSEAPSVVPGTLGGQRRSRIYGRLDCPSALRAIARGGPYATDRVFFADEATARAAGYRPCARCLPDAHRAWKAERAAALELLPLPSGRLMRLSGGACSIRSTNRPAIERSFR